MSEIIDILHITMLSLMSEIIDISHMSKYAIQSEIFDICNIYHYLSEIIDYILSYRHHHKTGLRNLQCNKSLTTAHDNICVIVKESLPQRYKLKHDEILAGLVTMKCRNMTKCWTCLTGKSSIFVIESEYDPDLWQQVWTLVKQLYDSDNPKHPKTIIENKKIYGALLDGYLETNTKIRGELP